MAFDIERLRDNEDLNKRLNEVFDTPKPVKHKVKPIKDGDLPEYKWVKCRFR